MQINQTGAGRYFNFNLPQSEQFEERSFKLSIHAFFTCNRFTQK
jgi:hypothetical protein